MKKQAFPIFLFMLLLFACQSETGTIKRISPNGEVITDQDKKIRIKGYHDADATVFFILRHAEETDPNDGDPPLSDIGKVRAERLAKVIEDIPIDLAASTNFLRTTQTANPFVAIRKPKIFVYNPDDLAFRFDDIVQKPKGLKVLVIGDEHSVPKFLNYLKAKEVYTPIPKNQYDRFYIAIVYDKGNAQISEWRY